MRANFKIWITRDLDARDSDKWLVYVRWPRRVLTTALVDQTTGLYGHANYGAALKTARRFISEQARADHIENRAVKLSRRSILFQDHLDIAAHVLGITP